MLSNKKHRNPYDANLRHDYHTTRKAFKKLIKSKKLKHLNSQIEDLVNHKDSHRFWDYLKSLKEGLELMDQALTKKSYLYYESIKLKNKQPFKEKLHISTTYARRWPLSPKTVTVTLLL